MTISNKLMLIVLLTIFEISLTLWSVFEISKGAKFHQLNFLHLKYTAEFSSKISSLTIDSVINPAELETIILNIQQQPIDCIDSVNFMNEFIMKQINTYQAVEICVKDIKDTKYALSILSQFKDDKLSKETLIVHLKNSADAFNSNSTLFEKPVKETVSFVMKAMIPLVIIISLFNILFITFMSKTISGSILNAIRLLQNPHKESLAEDIDNNVSGELKVLLDVARKRLKNELLITEVNQKLEKLVEQRTESLTRANGELSQFAYRTSHDLKAPLTASKQLTHFIIEDIQAGEIDTAIENTTRIHDQMGKLEELVMNILSLTEADSLEGSNSLIDFDKILNDIEQRCSGITDPSDYKIIREIPITIEMFNNPARITQILENLISNAIKYRDENKSELPLIKINVSEENNMFQLTVEDNGVGIPADRHNEVFLMFKRFHPKLSFGSGLGLAIIKKHIDYLNGTITMKTSNNGTTFSITIPKVDVI